MNRRLGFTHRAMMNQNLRPTGANQMQSLSARSSFTDYSDIPSTRFNISPELMNVEIRVDNNGHQHAYIRGLNEFVNTEIPTLPVSTLTEHFDPVYKFRPFKIYIISDQKYHYAITADEGTNNIVLKPFDLANKNQWVFIDSDTGAITFFTELKSYFNVTPANGMDVFLTRSDRIDNGDKGTYGQFVFQHNDTIAVKANPDFLLAYKKYVPPKPETTTAKPGDKPDDAGKPDKQPPQKPTEKFMAWIHEKFEPTTPKHAPTEPVLDGDIPFDPSYSPRLEAVRSGSIKDKYISKWKYTEIHDLRELTNNVDTINELTTINESGNKEITALQNLVANNKAISQLETEYRDEIINGYEKNWFINMFLKRD